MESVEQAQAQARPGQRRWTILALVVLAVLLVPAAILGAVDPGHWQALDRALNHPFIFGTAACGLVVAAALLGVRGSTRRELVSLTALITTFVIGGLAFGAVGAMDSQLAPGQHETARVDAPGAKPYRAITVESDDGSNPIWTVYLQSGHGLRTRQWEAACPEINEVQSVSWTTPVGKLESVGIDC